VKDREVAQRMTKFVELNAIGVDMQLQAAKVLRAVSDGYVDEDTDESSYIYRLGESPKWRPQNSCDGLGKSLERRPPADRTCSMAGLRDSCGIEVVERKGHPHERKRKIDGRKRITITSSSRIISLLGHPHT
jgi:hypothetical protein